MAASELTFSDYWPASRWQRFPFRTWASAGVTMFALPKPVTARGSAGRSPKSLPPGIFCVGGREIRFFEVGPAECRRTGIGIDARPDVIVERKQGRLVQTLVVAIDYPYMRPIEAVLRVAGQEPRPLVLKVPASAWNSPFPPSRPGDVARCSRL